MYESYGAPMASSGALRPAPGLHMVTCPFFGADYIPLHHDECDPVPTPAMADEYAALLIEFLINIEPSRKCH